MTRKTTLDDINKAESMKDLTHDQLFDMILAQTDVRNPPHASYYMNYIVRLWHYLQETDPTYSKVLKVTYIQHLEAKEQMNA